MTNVEFAGLLIGVTGLVIGVIGLVFAWPAFEKWRSEKIAASRVMKATQKSAQSEEGAPAAQKLLLEAETDAEEAEARITYAADRRAQAEYHEKQEGAKATEATNRTKQAVDFILDFGERAYHQAYVAADYQRALCKGSHTAEYDYQGMPQDLKHLRDVLPHFIKERQSVQLYRALVELRSVIAEWPEAQSATSPYLNSVLSDAARKLRAALDLVQSCRQ